jgi:hypothetical protein
MDRNELHEGDQAKAHGFLLLGGIHIALVRSNEHPFDEVIVGIEIVRHAELSFCCTYSGSGALFLPSRSDLLISCGNSGNSRKTE